MKHQQPVRFMRDNIFITHDGTAYAIWHLSGLPYGMAPTDIKHKVRAAHQALFQSISGQYTILGLVGTMSAQMIAEAMRAGVPATGTDQWQLETALTEAELAAYPPGARHFFFIAPLSRFNFREWWAKTSFTAETVYASALGIPLRPPALSRFDELTVKAQSIGKKIPSVFEPRPAGFAALDWIAKHLASRGSVTSGPVPHGHSGVVTVPGTVLPEPVVDEGDSAELMQTSKAPMRAVKLFNRRYVAVQADTYPTSYQCLGTLAVAPKSGFIFPGSEFVNVAADLPVDVDFALRITATPAASVRTKNKRAAKNIREQYSQRDGADSLGGGMADIDSSAEDLARYIHALGVTDREMEIAATIIFATSGPTAEIATDRMQAVKDTYATGDWIIDVPFGGQKDLFFDFYPGASRSATCADYEQITTASDFSLGVPLTSDELGMQTGFRVGVNITGGRARPVLSSLADLADLDIQGSSAHIGESGSGKSTAMKTHASYVVDRGGRIVVIDPSDNQEWAALARQLAETNVVDCLNPTASLDPLKVFGANSSGVRHTLSLLTQLLQVKITSDEGTFLGERLQATVPAGEVTSLAEFRDHLASATTTEDGAAARRVIRLMETFARTDYGQVLFNDTLPPISLDSPATVFCTHGLRLPSSTELSTESGRAEMSVEKIFGRALYGLTAKIAEHIMYEDDTQEVLFVIDEAHLMTASPEGMETIRIAVKTGRRHKSAVSMGTHSAAELGDEGFRSLIPQRFVYRTRDYALARTNLQFLHQDYLTEEMVTLVTTDLSPIDAKTMIVPPDRRGEALYRDPLNRVGKIRALIPRHPGRAATVLSTPGSRDHATASQDHTRQKGQVYV
ncbi:ATP-binding protein [Acaricomes phytoseiuli]|uniref:ATP-binding protein n=1 Tax=Acaricomes phytoseiuli TaxID=291968 RepID=UPI00039FB35F|nr:ATP-binding protein [Acaricomes phytoseiuli]